MRPGAVTTRQLRRMGSAWKQGEHVIITGPTGSGKTNLARYVVEERIRRGGFVLNMVMKLKPDDTILKEYRGWTRWERMKRHPNPSENRVLLWPRTDKLGAREALALQKEVFSEAIDTLTKVGMWTVQCDEGLYAVHPQFLNLGAEWSLLQAMGRSSRLSLVTLAQRPAHMPLLVWTSASYGFIGQSRESADLKRLAEMGGPLSSRELGARLARQTKHDFTFIDVGQTLPPESVNLSR